MQLKKLGRLFIRKARKAGFYALQKTTHYRFDRALEASLAVSAQRLLSGKDPARRPWEIRALSEFDFHDQARYKLHRADGQKTFVAAPDGRHTDVFGRRGVWQSRGVLVYEEPAGDRVLKTFPPQYAASGAACFLAEALAAGFYDHLCPLLEFLIHDAAGRLVGYAIKRGRQLTPFEFKRYVNGILRPLICAATDRSGFYYYDLVALNVILRDGLLSIIDLESVLPVAWFGKPPAYAAENLHILDTGYPIHTTWKSPPWYAAHLRAHQAAFAGREKDY